MTQPDLIGQRLAVFEDLDDIQFIIGRIISPTTHRIVAQALTLATALETIDDMADDKLTVDVLLLDGNLDTTRRDGYDAARIVQKLQGSNLLLRILGISAEPLAPVLQAYGYPMIDIGKEGLVARKLLPILDSFSTFER